MEERNPNPEMCTTNGSWPCGWFGKKIFERFVVKMEAGWSWLNKLPPLSLDSSWRAFWYSPSSMVTITSNSSPPASSSRTSSVTKKSCNRALSVPFLYKLHKASSDARFSAWTVRQTQPSVIWIRLVPAGSTHLLTAETSWSNVDPRLNTSSVEATVMLPATTLNTVFTVKTIIKNKMKNKVLVVASLDCFKTVQLF